eukprot:scaffold210649_cov51-Attheya_sp.AAC.1
MIFSTESIVSLFPELPWPLAGYVFWAVFFASLPICAVIGVFPPLAFKRCLENPLNMPLTAVAEGKPERCRPRWLLAHLFASALMVAGYYGKSDIYRVLIWPSSFLMLFLHSQMVHERCQGRQICNLKMMAVCTLFQATFLFMIMYAVMDESATARLFVKLGMCMILLTWFIRFVTLAQAGFNVDVWAKGFLCPASMRENKKTK